MAEYVNIRVRKGTYERLKELAGGAPLVRFLDDACKHWSTNKVDEGERLLEELDNKNEHPEDYISDDDRAILKGLAPGELPACCQEIFDDPEHPVPTCKHWRQAYENYYGQRMWGYVNDLVGGGYRTWFSKYVK